MANTNPDGHLTLTVPDGGYINLRLLASSDPSWKWGSSSSTTSAETAATTSTPVAGDVDIWLAAGKSVYVEIKRA